VIRHLSHLRSSGVPRSSGFIFVTVPAIADLGIDVRSVRGYPIALPRLVKTKGLFFRESLWVKYILYYFRQNFTSKIFFLEIFIIYYF
jgi:hypothetical protein